MAYVFLKGLGVDGDIATITLHYGDGKATASEGQKVLSAKGGAGAGEAHDHRRAG